MELKDLFEAIVDGKLEMAVAVTKGAVSLSLIHI